MTKREPDAELVDHYAGEGIGWGFLALLLAVALGLVFLGVGIGLWYGDARGETRGYAKGLEDQAAADRGREQAQAQAHRACVERLLQVESQLQLQATPEPPGWEEKLLAVPSRDLRDCETRGWELGYRQAREDWERPCLGR